jgi:hypothetical protein
MPAWSNTWSMGKRIMYHRKCTMPTGVLGSLSRETQSADGTGQHQRRTRRRAGASLHSDDHKQYVQRM